MSKTSKNQQVIINDLNLPSPKVSERQQNELPPSIKLYSNFGIQLTQQRGFTYSNQYKAEEGNENSAGNSIKRPLVEKGHETISGCDIIDPESRHSVNKRDGNEKPKFSTLQSHQIANKKHFTFQYSKKIETNAEDLCLIQSNQISKEISFIKKKHDKLRMIDSLSGSSSKAGSRTLTPNKFNQSSEGHQVIDCPSPQGVSRRFQMTFKKLEFEHDDFGSTSLRPNILNEVVLNQLQKREQYAKNQIHTKNPQYSGANFSQTQTILLKQPDQPQNETQNKNVLKTKIPPKMVAGDWCCTVCNNINFARRSNCNACNMPKPYEAILKARSSQLGPPGLFKDTDWQCFNCLNINFQKRQNCNRCQAPKPQEYKDREAEFEEHIVNLEEDLMIQNESRCPQIKSNGFHLKHLTAKNEEENEGCDLDAPSGLKPFVRSVNDWNCSQCNNINFARRTNCNICNMPKPTHEILKTKSSCLGPPGLFKDTDWQCFECRNINFAKRVCCNLCYAPKPQEYIDRKLNNNDNKKSNDSKSNGTGMTNSVRENSFVNHSNKNYEINSVNFDEDPRSNLNLIRESRSSNPSQRNITQRQQQTSEALKKFSFDKVQGWVPINEQKSLLRERSRSFIKAKNDAMESI